MTLPGFLADITFSIIATGALVGIAGSLLGSFLILRRSSMLADAMSHSIVFGIVIVWLITGLQSGPVQILGAALTGLLTVVLVQLLASTGRIADDASIGLVYPFLFSIGVLLLNLYARDVHIDTHTVLLGEIGFVWLDTLPLGGQEIARSLLTMAAMTLVNLTFVWLFFKELKLMTFDWGLARSLGLLPGLLYYLLLGLTSTTAVAAFDAVGAILFVAFVIVPPAAAYLLTDRLVLMIVYGCLISILSSVIGYYLAVYLNVSIGGAMATLTGVFLLLALLAGPRHGLLAQEFTRIERRRGDYRRALVVHLYRHEGTGDQADESSTAALREHLHWSDRRARKVLSESLDRRLVARENGGLVLTDRGRNAAREILEPWAPREEEAKAASSSGPWVAGTARRPRHR